MSPDSIWHSVIIAAITFGKSQEINSGRKCSTFHYGLSCAMKLISSNHQSTAKTFLCVSKRPLVTTDSRQKSRCWQILCLKHNNMFSLSARRPADYNFNIPQEHPRVWCQTALGISCRHKSFLHVL